MKSNIITNIVVVGLFIFGGIYFFIQTQNQCTKDLVKQRSRHLSGTVAQKYLDPDNKLEPTIVLFNNKTEFKCVFFYFEKSYELMDTGDSIFKPYGSLEMTIFKKGGDTMTYRFDCEGLP
jgi:hypothetical protein